MLIIPSNYEQTPPIKVLPPAGGDGGQVVDVAAMPQHLESVTIRHGDVIDSISFSYIDITGRKQIGGPWGGNGGISNTVSVLVGVFVVCLDESIASTHPTKLRMTKKIR
jgi:GTPase involved in cell partitioning and DNA repair